MNDGVVLGFDTSNYKTSTAWFCPSDGSWKSEGKLLEVPEGTLGLRQSDALFQHVRRLPDIAGGTFTGVPVLAIGCSDKPRTVEGSYMPCFLAGVSVARSMAYALGVPCRLWSHQQGHLASAAFSCRRVDLLTKEFYAWHLSGGTTELLHVFPGLNCEIVGGTQDISAGQLIDRTGVLLGMPFPAGPYVEKEALQCDKPDYFSVKIREGFFSLSGMENKVKDMNDQGIARAVICRFVLETISSAVLRATLSVQEKGELPVLISGGVSANQLLRTRLSAKPNFLFAQHGLGGDNALGACILTAWAEGLL